MITELAAVVVDVGGHQRAVGRRGERDGARRGEVEQLLAEQVLPQHEPRRGSGLLGGRRQRRSLEGGSDGWCGLVWELGERHATRVKERLRASWQEAVAGGAGWCGVGALAGRREAG